MTILCPIRTLDASTLARIPCPIAPIATIPQNPSVPFSADLTSLAVGGIAAGAASGSAFEIATGLRYACASVAAVQTSDRQIAAVSSDVARIGQPSAAAMFRGLLLEEQRMNLVVQNRSLTNAAWQGASETFHATQTAAYANGPDGTLAATRVQKAGTPNYSTYQLFTAVAGRYSLSSWNRTTDGASFYASDFMFGVANADVQILGVSPTWAPFSVIDPVTYAGGETITIYPVGDTSLGQISGQGDTLVDLAQVELGAFPTSPIICGASATTRAGGSLYHPNGSTLVNADGRLRLDLEFIAMGSTGDYSSSQYLFDVDGNNYSRLDTSGHVTAVIGGISAAFAAPIAWNAMDLVRIFLEVGGGIASSLTVSINGVTPTVQTAASLGGLGVPGFMFLLCSGTSNQLSSWIRKIAAYS